MTYRVAICNNISGDDWIDGYVGEITARTVAIGTSEFMAKPFHTEQEASDYIGDIRKLWCDGPYSPITENWKTVAEIYNSGFFLKVVEEGTGNTAEPDDDIEELDDED